MNKHMSNLHLNNLCQEIVLSDQTSKIFSEIIKLSNFTEISTNEHFINFVIVFTQNTFSTPLKDSLRQFNSPDIQNNFLLPQFLKYHIEAIDEYLVKDNTIAHQFHDQSIKLNPLAIFQLFENSNISNVTLSKIFRHIFDFMSEPEIFDKLDTYHDLPENFFTLSILSLDFEQRSFMHSSSKSSFIIRLLKYVEANFTKEPQKCYQYIKKLANLQAKFPILKIHTNSFSFNSMINAKQGNSAFSDFFQLPSLRPSYLMPPHNTSNENPSWLSLLFSIHQTPNLINENQKIPAFHFINLSFQLIKSLNIIHYIQKKNANYFPENKDKRIKTFQELSGVNAYFSNFLWDNFTNTFVECLNKKQFTQLQVSQFVVLIHLLEFEFDNFHSDYFKDIRNNLNLLISTAKSNYPTLFTDRFQDIAKYSPALFDTDIFITNFNEDYFLINRSGHYPEVLKTYFNTSNIKSLIVFIENIQQAHLLSTHDQSSQVFLDTSWDKLIDLTYSLNNLLIQPREYDTLSNYSLTALADNKYLARVSLDFSEKYSKKYLSGFSTHQHIQNPSLIKEISDNLPFLNTIEDFSQLSLLYDYANHEIKEKITNELNYFYNVFMKKMTTNVSKSHALFFQINSLDEYPVQTTSLFRQSFFQSNHCAIHKFLPLLFGKTQLNDFYKHLPDDILLNLYQEFTSTVIESLKNSIQDLTFYPYEDNEVQITIQEKIHNTSIFDGSQARYSRSAIASIFLSLINSIIDNPFSVETKSLIFDQATTFSKESATLLLKEDTPLFDNSKNDMISNSLRESILRLHLQIHHNAKEKSSKIKKKI